MDKHPVSHFILPDVQAKPNQDFTFLTCAGKFVAEHKPDVIICIGDFADMPSLSSYDKGKKSFEGRRYTDDIKAAHNAMKAFMQPIWDEQNSQRKNKKKIYKPRMVLTLGNHECVAKDTEILTSEGWKIAENISKIDKVANVSKNNTLYFESPIELSTTLDYGYNLKGDYTEESVSKNHHIILDNIRTPVHSVKENIKNIRFTNAVLSDCENPLSDIQVKLMTWVVCDGTMVNYSENKKRIQWKLSKERKITELKKVLDEANLKYTFRKAPLSPTNKLQPYYICLYGDEARYVFDLMQNKKEFPKNLYKRLNNETAKVLIETLSITDGSIKDRSVILSTVSKNDAEEIQLACALNGFPAKYKIRENVSGFKNGKPQYHINISYLGLSNKFSTKVEKTNILQEYIAIQTTSEKLITRRNGKIVITGNCRISRAIEDDRKLENLISIDDLSYDDFGWEVIPFLKPITIDGVSYCHYFVSGVKGQPVSSARALVTKKHMSCVMGHAQQSEIDMSQKRADGIPLIGLFCGIFYEHDEEYLDPQSNIQHRQVWMNREVKDGFFYPHPISLDYLKRKYS